MRPLLATLAYMAFFGVVTALALPSGLSTHLGPDKPASKASPTGQTFDVPYRLAETNHFLIRVRINGKGPFNFLVDSGAPALYIATETARKASLKTSETNFWTFVKQLELEGGIVLTDVKARVEDPFQLVGMNALGLPGASIDGILGFTVLARFRLEIDPTRDSMTWTLLDYLPPEPPVPGQGNGKGQKRPRELQALSALGPFAKGLAFLIGKQPEEKRLLRGFLGFQWREERISERETHTVVSLVFKGSPAYEAGLRTGDRLLSVNSHPISSLQSAQAALAKIQAGDSVELSLERESNGKEVKGIQQLTITVTATEGF